MTTASDPLAFNGWWVPWILCAIVALLAWDANDSNKRPKP